MSSTSRVKLSVGLPDPEASQPVLLHFASGLPPASALNNAPKEGGLKLRLTKSTSASDKRKAWREVQAENATVCYDGANYGRDGPPPSVGGTLLIGVHKRGTDYVRLLQPGALFPMRLSVKEPQVPLTPPEPAAPAEGANRAAENYAQKRKLVSTLGAARAVKKQKQLESAAVSAGAVFNSASLGADIAGAAQAAEDAAPTERTARELHPLHPPFDLEATTLENAYPRTGIIPSHVWAVLPFARLKDAAKSAEERLHLAAKPALWPAYVLDQLAHSLPSEKSARHAHMRVLLYLTYVLRFASLRHPIKPKKKQGGGASSSADTDGLAAGCDHHPDAATLQIPLAPWEQLLADFTEVDMMGGRPSDSAAPAGKKRIISRTCREKVALYALTLALILGKGNLPCAALAPTLGLTEEKCAFYMKQLGCKVEKVRPREGGEKVSTAVLTLPLAFPKLSRGGKARQR